MESGGFRKDDWYSDSAQGANYSSNNTGYGQYGQIGGAIGGQPQYSSQTFTSNGFDTSGSSNQFNNDYDEDEPPLLEELGINFSHIYSKTLSVINPTKTLNKELLEDSDLAGPLVFCWMQGSFLLLTGKLHYGYLFGFGIVGCFLLQSILNLMNQNPSNAINSYRVVSILGYSLLPIVALSGLSIAANLGSGYFGMILSVMATLWSTVTATRFFEAAMGMGNQRYLIAYPVFLFYTAFALITVF